MKNRNRVSVDMKRNAEHHMLPYSVKLCVFAIFNNLSFVFLMTFKATYKKASTILLAEMKQS